MLFDDSTPSRSEFQSVLTIGKDNKRKPNLRNIVV